MKFSGYPVPVMVLLIYIELRRKIYGFTFIPPALFPEFTKVTRQELFHQWVTSCFPETDNTVIKQSLLNKDLGL
jgi:hypothetical protein